MEEYKKILSCWNKLEYFSPASLPKGSEELKTIEPWNNTIRSSDPKKAIEYTIYLGVFDSFHVSDFVKVFFDDKDRDENEKNSKICFAALKLDSNGFYKKDSLGISTLPWALSQLEKGNIDSNRWSSSFERIKDILFADFEYVFNTVSVNEEEELLNELQPIQNGTLKELENRIESLCGWSIKPDKKIYFKCEEVYISAKDNSNAEILNSFYTEDLEKVISSIDSGIQPKAFTNYLNGSLNKKGERLDIIKDVSEVKKSLSPLNFPDGCWPSKYTLSLMQQFAVNRIFNSLANPNQTGLFSVNGPPGTGKTTLLRDIIAPIIVKRAKALSKFGNPANAFKKVGEVKIKEGFTPFVYAPDETIIEAGVVVTSSNNGAVENISKELPVKGEVAPFSQQVAYFREVAENCISSENWGLISAVLGNKQNRSELVSKIWFKDNVPIGLQKKLRESKYSDLSSWQMVVKEFNQKLEEVTSEKQKLETYRCEYHEFVRVSIAKDELEGRLAEKERELGEIQHKAEKQKEIVSTLDKRKRDALNELSIIQQNRPNFFVYWFNRTLRNEYKQSLQFAFKQYNTVTEECKLALAELQKKEELLGEIKLEHQAVLSELALIIPKFNSLKEITSKAREELGQNYADDNFWDKIESKESQQACPWYSSKLKELQSELFILSLNLNEQFILHANSKSNRIQTTLTRFFEYLKGDVYPSREVVKAMWDTFFLVIPVVSSTFASVQRMFRDLGKEDLPWLFIDEAGQAVPQAAVGAIWRSKRVAIVGDPLQIEPVVTIPRSLINNISSYFELDSTNVNSELSVQTMADRVNPWGTYLSLNSDSIWVGMPLRVHRRCLSPMFDIANSIAYGDTMYSATSKPNVINVRLENSFIHCEGMVEGRHFVKEQAEIVKKMLIDEIHACKGFPDIFVITPFSEISYKMNDVLFFPLLNAIKKYIPDVDNGLIQKMIDWIKSHVGTVHTFQGKQADGVILCLGLDVNSKGAACWASNKPNLLNVALTRAKYRFVAVGDKRIWLNQQYFDKLKVLNMN